MNGHVEASNYTALAEIYDVVMAHVDYRGWARHVHGLLVRHAPEARSILELGCGTGSLALELRALGSYRYLATDGSEQMLTVARRKFESADDAIESAAGAIEFATLKFPVFRTQDCFDVALLLYDGLNYLLDTSDIECLLASVYESLEPGAVFLFDQSTPSNSLKNQEFFEDAGQHAAFSYVRTSRYDPNRCLHTTRFEIATADRVLEEEHVQRAYTMEEVLGLLDPARWPEIHSYDGFSMNAATDASERIHWVIRKNDGARWS